MKKRSKIIKLALAFLFTSVVTLGGYNLYTNIATKNKGKVIHEEQTFVDSGKDELSEELIYQQALLLNSTIEDTVTPAQENANEDSLLCSKMYVQYGTNSEGKQCLRYVVAVPHLDVDVTFTRTLKYNGTTTSKNVKPTVAYSAISAGGNTITPDEMNNETLGTDYQYFVCYTMSGITDDYAELDVEVSVTDLITREVGEAYKAANVAGLTYTAEQDVDTASGEFSYQGLKYTYSEGTAECKGLSDDTLTSIEIPDVLPHRLSATIVEGIPVTSIGETSFLSTSVTSVTIGNNVTNIGMLAFFDCKASSITIGNRVASIGDHAFDGCINVKLITIPNSVTSIGDSAFLGCVELSTVYIGTGVTSICSAAFSGCGQLYSFNYNGTKSQWSEINKGDQIFFPSAVEKIICSDGEIDIED